MRKLLTASLIVAIAIVFLFCSLLLSCSTVKNIDCKSSRLLPVVFVAKNGYAYTVMVPFCDTVFLKENEVIKDSVVSVLKTKE